MAIKTRREELLDQTMGYVVEHGFAGLSLRELAKAIGTSHRMLIYHFGSRAELLIAVSARIEEAQRQFLAEMMADSTVSPEETGRLIWSRFADPLLWPAERLFFEIYGQSLQCREGTEGFAQGAVDAWLAPLAAYAERQGSPPGQARAHGRLALAVTRGLLLDLLATEDQQGVQEAVECYAALYDAFLQANAGRAR